MICCAEVEESRTHLSAEAIDADRDMVVVMILLFLKTMAIKIMPPTTAPTST